MDAKETSFFTAVLIISVVLGIIIIYFIISIIRQQRKNLQLYRQNVLAEITAMEKERARIAADLHDDLGPMLSAVKLKINNFDLIDEDDQKEVEKTNDHIDSLMKRMREISYDLIPNTLIRKGLVLAVREFIEFTSNASSLKISFTSPADMAVTEQKAIHLYRIIQEIIHNTIKHSKATELTIDLTEKNGTLFLLTRDNGVGFDHQGASMGNGGIGLRNMLSRAEIIGGTMYVDSEKAKGTKYTFEIPVK